MTLGVPARITSLNRRLALLVGAAAAFLAGCERTDLALVPDPVLQAELGLTERDQVHTIDVQTGASERADPETLEVDAGDYVQFVSADHFVHEIRFLMDSLSAEQRAFLGGLAQDASPPLLERGARFLITTQNAPPGRYPFELVGNRAPGQGAIVVRDPEAR